MTPPAIYRRHIPEDRLEGKPLGRHVVHDPRSKEYPAETASKLVSKAHLAVGLPLNQKATGKCTGEALAGDLNSQPNYKGGNVLTDTDTDRIYEVETQLEGQPWSPSNPTVNDIGGSGLMVCRAGKKLGLVRSYHHAFGLDHALRALVLRPAMFGVDWYDGFDQPDRNGLVSISGSVRGGHEVCALEIDVENELVWFAQSWDLEYGVARPSIGLLGGAFAMSFQTVGTLLDRQGDCTVAYAV